MLEHDDFTDTVTHDVRQATTERKISMPIGTECNSVVALNGAADEVVLVSEMTREVFGVAPTLVLQKDPEIDHSYVVVNVPVTGTDESILSQVNAWHRRLSSEIAGSTSYCLSPLFE